MPVEHSRYRKGWFIALFVTGILVYTTLPGPVIHQSTMWPLHGASVAPTDPAPSAIRSKTAFAVYLAETENEENPGVEDDCYFTSIRMMAYQLLHDPETRTNNSIPFVVMVSPGVNESKRERLTKEGATVIQVPHINIEWMKPGRERWKRVMDKLNVLLLTQYERVLLMDSDIVIFKRLDGIFDEPETKLLRRIQHSDPNAAPLDEGPQPEVYLMAADSSPVGGDNHDWPAKRNGVLNAGFVVVHPSIEVYDHQIRVASIEGRTPGTAPENNLWEYIYRKNGSMPFSHIKGHWVMNGARYEDWEHGVHAVHEKWWRNSLRDKKLKRLLERSRWRMDGYWSRKD